MIFSYAKSPNRNLKSLGYQQVLSKAITAGCSEGPSVSAHLSVECIHPLVKMASKKKSELKVGQPIS